MPDKHPTSSEFTRCQKCNKLKLKASDFYANRSGTCKLCHKQANKDIYWRNRDRILARFKSNRERTRDKYLIRKYRISSEKYASMLLEQNGVCAICGGVSRGRRLSVDHSHLTHKVRALLCNNCNSLLGHSRDNPGILRQAASYLELYFDENVDESISYKLADSTSESPHTVGVGWQTKQSL